MSQMASRSFENSTAIKSNYMSYNSGRPAAAGKASAPKITVNKFQIQNGANSKRRGQPGWADRGHNSRSGSQRQQRSARLAKDRGNNLRRKPQPAHEEAQEDDGPANLYRQIASDLDIIDRNTEQICQKAVMNRNKNDKRADIERMKLLQLQK